MLPGSGHPTVSITGRIIRLHDEDTEPGPVRMGLAFNQFRHHVDRLRLDNYLANAMRKAA